VYGARIKALSEWFRVSPLRRNKLLYAIAGHQRLPFGRIHLVIVRVYGGIVRGTWDNRIGAGRLIAYGAKAAILTSLW